MADSSASSRSGKSNSLEKLLCLFLHRIQLPFGIMPTHQTNKGIIGAFQECTKTNCRYLVACFYLSKASSSILPDNIKSTYI